MSFADPSAATVQYLLSSAVTDLVSGRIFRPRLPAGQVESMPQGCIVVRRAGGYTMFGATNPPVGDPRLDLFCYGETELDAENIAGAVAPVLRRLRQSTWRWTDENGDPQATRLYWALISGGPNPFDDPETNWPCALLTAQVAYCEIAVT